MFGHDLTPAPRVDGLSEIEHEILGLLLDGYDTSAIAAAREKSPRTIANQVASIPRCAA